MNKQAPVSKRHFPWGPLLLILLFVVVMVPLSLVDYNWTVYLYRHNIPWLSNFMKNTLFDGGSPGASDIAIFYFLVVAVAYFSKRFNSLTGQRFRPFLGFVFFSSFFSGLGLVHSFKWMVGRARPNLVLEGKLTFSHWYQLGPQYITDGIFYGSFPSGHTATVILLITLGYYLVNDPMGSWRQKFVGWIYSLLVLILTGLMILGRSMTLDHWLTDSVGIALLSIFSIHLLYFYILKIPAQRQYVAAKGDYAPLPRIWEAKLVWRMFLVIIGIMAVVIGLRAPFAEQPPWLLIIVLPGLYLCYRFSISINKTYREAIRYFQPYVRP